MGKKTFYIANSEQLDEILLALKDAIPCFINREYIEMDFSQVEIVARIEDWVTVENYLAPIV